MSDNYGFLAPCYQWLSRLIFGKDLIRANRAFLSQGVGKRILVIGGGDGTAYREMEGRWSGEFWDLSPEMVRLARKNLGNANLYIHCGRWDGRGNFDQIYFPFVLDTMVDREIEDLLSRARKSLNPDGRVIISDFFAPVTFRQRLVQKVMIWIFQLLAAHKRGDLPDIPGLMSKSGFCLEQELFWRKGWIGAHVYQVAEYSKSLNN